MLWWAPPSPAWACEIGGSPGFHHNPKDQTRGFTCSSQNLTRDTRHIVHKSATSGPLLKLLAHSFWKLTYLEPNGGKHGTENPAAWQGIRMAGLHNESPKQQSPLLPPLPPRGGVITAAAWRDKVHRMLRGQHAIGGDAGDTDTAAGPVEVSAQP
ncbi:hypothetical protein P7K49_029990 [Saguinus oedipus]|uniref:Uncharacterized protein n=1 Tax=Saguinus oedipus TaxID=9490 RepID=A0ABQ9U8S9_SAGOE|nr:hypothetical protein P7K49_029990 [Saguinus oedipus]